MGYEVHVACDWTNRSVWSDEKVTDLKNRLEELKIKYYQIDYSRSMFDFYTLKGTYDFLGIKHDSVAPHHLKFFSYGDGTYSSNIYTSLVLPIQDYGIIGMLISRMIISFTCTKIFNRTILEKIGNKMFLLFL